MLFWFLIFFAFLCLLVVAVYALSIVYFYWGDKKGPPENR
jgi:hypothetical protein